MGSYSPAKTLKYSMLRLLNNVTTGRSFLTSGMCEALRNVHEASFHAVRNETVKHYKSSPAWFAAHTWLQMLGDV